MFGNLVALNKVQHKALMFTPGTTYPHAAGERWVPVVSAEFDAAAQEHVIVFATQAGALPLLLVGLEDARNAYVDPQGHWRAAYVPARVRHYPFALIERPASANASEAQRSFLLGLDAQASHFAGSAGTALINEDGTWSALLDKEQRSLVSMEADAERTRFMVQQLDDAGLLKAMTVPVYFTKDPQAGVLSVSGMRMVDPSAYQALSDAQRTALSASGALGMVEAHLRSLRNLAGGPLGAAAQALVARQQAAAAPADGGRFLDPDLLAAERARDKERPALVAVQPSARGLFAKSVAKG